MIEMTSAAFTRWIHVLTDLQLSAVLQLNSQCTHSVYLRRLFEVSYLETASAIHMVTGEIRYSKDLVKKREKF